MNHRGTSTFEVDLPTLQPIEITPNEQGHQIHGICSPDNKVNSWAQRHQINTFTQDTLLSALQTHPFDYLFSIVNSWVIPAEVIQLPRKAAINYHDSFPPNTHLLISFPCTRSARLQSIPPNSIPS